ncbi:hypothetical protein ACFWY9_02035 [Amycolatopsis sp. NPDC059027]|uniref:hypothetical protein n=1 Tax=unclassified Amycolatopsis TaxID=2618356 RepID=UPI00366B3F93
MHQQHPGLLVVEEHEAHQRHVLVRRRDEAGLDRLRIGAAPLSEGELLVLATPGALQVPSLASALPELLREHLAGIELLWLGVGGLAADTEAAQRLAEDLGVEIAAPDGGLVAMPGAALYAGHGAGGTGWHRFSPDQLVRFHGARFPLPEWESWLPAGPVPLGAVVAAPVPCGLLVRSVSDASTAVDTAFDVAVNQRFPKIVVMTPSAAEVAELLGGFPPQPVMVVPATPEAAAHTWQIELALRLSRDVVFSAGPQLDGTTVVPGGAFRPFPIVLRQAADGGDQEVLAVAPPPPGWEREGQRSYRLAGSDGDPVLADVVPSGLVLRAADGDADPDAAAAPFDPARWTLTVGAAGQPVGLPVLAAAERLLEALPDGERAAVRVRIAGAPDREAAHALDHRAANRKPTPPPAPSRPGPPSSRPLVPSRPAPRPSTADSAVPRRAFRSEPADSVPARPAGSWAPSGAQPMTPAVPAVPAGPVPPRVPPGPDGAVPRRGSGAEPPDSGSGRPAGGWAPAGSRSALPADPAAPAAPSGPGGVASQRAFGSGLPDSVPARPAEGRAPGGARPVPPTGPGPVPPVVPSELDGVAPRRASRPEPADSVPARPVGGWAPSAARPMTPAVPAVPAGPGPGPVPPVAPSGPGSVSPPPAGSQTAPPVVPPAAAAPPSIMTTSGAPVSTVSSGITPSTVSGPSKGSPPREEPAAETVRMETVEVEPEAEVEAETAPAAGPSPQPAPPAETEPPAPSADAEPAPPASPALQPVAVPVRASTTAEQNRFVTAAGEDFGIALATVNAALATWPSMRVDESPAGKADYVAVCLYLSRGEGAANLVNGALRTGEGAVLDGQIPCLMSGLRRLPTHRRAVLRQGKVAESLEHRGTPGTVLTEPGFLAASMDLDVTVPGADLDVLIWPASARRTSELMLSRPVGEAVFTAGARFKTLAVRSVSDEEREEPEDDPDALSAPKIAVLFRELAPGETLESTDLDDRDRAALAKLDNVLAGRRSAALRLVEDPDTIARLTTSMVLWRDEAAGEGKPVAVAS